jgi:putative thiamine transport system ATP-binding protein
MLELRRVSLSLAGRPLVQPFSLTIAAGDIGILMGPSGCGKSSLLSYIAGDIEEPVSGTGEVLVSGESVLAMPPARRRIGRMFQDDLLFPHMSIGGNLLFGMARGDRLMREERMRQALEAVELAGYERRMPQSLSGGQRQRVALMRALLAEPRAMLLDEPFNRLDQELRTSMRSLVYRHIRDARIPCLLVTHDRADAPDGAQVWEIGRDGEVRNA